MADARICDCCNKVFGAYDKADKPIYRLFVRDDNYDSERSIGKSEYKEPELCPECKQKLYDLISASDFGKFY